MRTVALISPRVCDIIVEVGVGGKPHACTQVHTHRLAHVHTHTRNNQEQSRTVLIYYLCGTDRSCFKEFREEELSTVSSHGG